MGLRSLVAWDVVILVAVVLSSVRPPAYMRRMWQRTTTRAVLAGMIGTPLVSLACIIMVSRIAIGPYGDHMPWWPVDGEWVFISACALIQGSARYRFARRSAELG